METDVDKLIADLKALKDKLCDSPDYDPNAINLVRDAYEYIESINRDRIPLYQNIDPKVFNNACLACRSYAGMGDIKIVLNPYELRWKVEISFNADDTPRYKAHHEDVNIALDEVAEMVHANPPKIDGVTWGGRPKGV